MKKLAVVALVALGVGGPALAADIPLKARPLPPPPPPCAQFGGFYVGGYVGAGSYDHNWHDLDDFAGKIDDDIISGHVQVQKSGFIGGVQAGWNWQSRCTVFGVQADYGWSSIKASVDISDGELGDSRDAVTITSKLRGIGTLRARTGIVMDNVLLYVTGGLAWANFSRSTEGINDINGFVTEPFSSSKTKWGWVAGVGSEWSIWGNWSLQGEVLYARFEKDTQTFTCVVVCTDGPDPTPTFRIQHQDSVWITKIGLNYRFGDWGKYPVAARY